MQMDAGLDTGPMLLPSRRRSAAHHRRRACTTRWPRSARGLIARARSPRTAAAAAAAGRGRNLRAPSSPARTAGSTGASRRAALERLVRAFDPWPGTFSSSTARRSRCWPRRVAVAGEAPPGTRARRRADRSPAARARCGLLGVQRAGRRADGRRCRSCAAIRSLASRGERAAAMTAATRCCSNMTAPPFVGWQRQTNGLSVQEVAGGGGGHLRAARSRAIVAGRTDAGVHAEGAGRASRSAARLRARAVRDGAQLPS